MPRPTAEANLPVARSGGGGRITYRFVEHVGEVEIELEAAGEAGLFEAALAAFAELVGVVASGDPASRELELAASDNALLLELRRNQTAAIEGSLEIFAELCFEYEELSRRSYGPFDAYRLEDADHALVCLGSSAGTTKDVVDALRAQGEAVGLLKICSFRPFPAEAIRAVLGNVPAVSVLDRADSPGGAPPLYAEVTVALAGGLQRLSSYVYGLGGRDLHPADIRAILDRTAPHYVGVRSTACHV
jgi:pyruvate/2-oxoacid:ferredoxin oxidoreductase alpha subunit